MILHSLLALAALQPAPRTSAPSIQSGPQVQQNTTTKKQSKRAKNLLRQQALKNLLARGNGSQQISLGGSFSTGVRGPIVSVGPSLAPGVFQLQLDDPGTGWQESVVLGVPRVRSSQPVPLLVMFHGADISEWDCYVNGTDMFEGARNKGWYVLAPLGAHQVNFGIPYSQVNIEYAMTLFSQVLPIDRERIYGVGFSMGGGTMMSYASRHMDPDKPRFAALVNHTGTVSTANVYWNSQAHTVFDNALTFAGSPALFPFLYSQASALDIDHLTLQVNPSTDLGRNLASVPVLNYHADFDPQSNLVAVTQTVFNWLGQIPGMETFLLTPPRNVHHWSTLDENTALNYLRSKRLNTPTTGQHRVLADREARWWHFDILQDTPGAFTPFEWDFDAQLNRLLITQTENLKSVIVDSRSLGLNTSVNLRLIMHSTDGGAESTTLKGYALQPQQILRNGQPTQSWSWDPQAQAITLVESNPAAGAVWKIRP